MPEPLVELNPLTASTHGIADNSWVTITTSEGSMEARAKFNPGIAVNVVCSQYGWWSNLHREANWNYNNIISDSDFDPISSSNTLRNFRCNITNSNPDNCIP
jgi:anaerobic selenocysteine-containing dehydrogenase